MATQMLDGDAVEAVAGLARQGQDADRKTAEINGHIYSTVPLHLVYAPKDAEPAALVVHTLSGLVEYLETNRDELPLGQLVLHVKSPAVVELRSRLTGHHSQRFTYVRAELYDRFAAVTGFAFSRYLQTEALVIALQALFEDRGHRAELLRVVGSVKNEAVREEADDGVSQTVTARAGVRLVAEVPVPNPVQLAPFRTFAEVEQPLSPFVFRARRDGEAVMFALFEADGGAWQNAATYAVADWLREHVEGVPVLA